MGKLEAAWGPGVVRRDAALVRDAGRIGWLRAPVTLTFLTVFWVLGIFFSGVLTGPQGTPGPHDAVSLSSVSASAWTSHWWALLTSGIWAGSVAGYLVWTPLVALVGIPIELRIGSVRFAAAAVATQVLGIGAAIGFAWSLKGLMGSWSGALLGHAYLGPSAFLCGVALVATAAMDTLWRRRLRLFLMVLLILLALYSGSFPDVVRLGAATAGAVLGPVFFGRRPRLGLPVSSRREGRVLVALVLAASAVGPVLAGLLPHAVGPLSVLRFLFTNIQPVDAQTLQSLCTDRAHLKACLSARLQLRAGAGGIFMSILPSVLLILAADGLRRGRRFAWYLALLLQGVLAVLAATHIVRLLLPGPAGTRLRDNMGGLDLTRFHHPLSVVLPLLLPVAMFGMLLAARRLFSVAAPPKTYARLARRLAATGAALAAVYVAGALLLADGFDPVPDLVALVQDVPDRFLPLGYTMDLPPAFFPQSTPAVLLYEGIGVVFWAVAGWLLLVSFLRPAHGDHGRDVDRARSLLRGQESGALSWMTTWAGNSYWFSPTGNSYFAFRVISGIALALGDPVGPAAERRTSLEQFGRFCSVNGWTPCLYSVSNDVNRIAKEFGWGSVEVAQETILPLDSIVFAGKDFQDIRTALNKAAKEGISAEWITYPTAPRGLVDQIHSISEEWIADKDLPEMGFTLGGIDELNDPEVRCLVAIDGQRTVHAVASWLPVYRHGRIVGWTLDFMRRRSGGFRSGMEFLIASAALSLKAEGYEFISLSGAPLARMDHASHEPGPGPRFGTLDRMLDWLGAALEPVYGFRSLLAFKAKFQPRYEPLFMVYPDGAALPSIGTAISRAYLPHVSLRQRIILIGKILRRPAPARTQSVSRSRS